MHCRVFPRQHDKNIYLGFGFERIIIERSLFTLTNIIIHTYNVFGRFLFRVIYSRTANLGEASSALLRAQLSLALAGYELHWSQVKVKVTSCPHSKT
jgi:hypothetical protein